MTDINQLSIDFKRWADQQPVEIRQRAFSISCGLTYASRHGSMSPGAQKAWAANVAELERIVQERRAIG
jgi:hypothetical protein